MAAKKTTEDVPENEPIPVDEGSDPQAKQRRARKPLEAVDLPSAAEVLRRAQNRAQRAERAYAAASKEREESLSAVADAKEALDRFYRELMGESHNA